MFCQIFSEEDRDQRTVSLSVRSSGQDQCECESRWQVGDTYSLVRSPSLCYGATVLHPQICCYLINFPRSSEGVMQIFC